MKQHTKIALIVIFVVGLWVASWLLAFCCLPKLVTIGDMFGALSALFSGLAFVGVVYALLLQHEELAQTKAEFVRNAQAQKEVAQLQALTVLFQEYERLSKGKDTEISNFNTNAKKLSDYYDTDFYKTLTKERDEILRQKHKIFSSLEKTAGLEDSATSVKSK